MNYYLDTEFHEGFHKPLFGKRRHFIDLISIGIYAEDGREFYAISKDFDIRAAWDAHDLKVNKLYPMGPEYLKVYWLRENVLKLIWIELEAKEHISPYAREWARDGKYLFTYNRFRSLILKYGVSNKQIAESVKDFVNPVYSNFQQPYEMFRQVHGYALSTGDVAHPSFFGYYSDYDWVLFCSIYGKMINLPRGFPMYCIDLKQMMDDRAYFYLRVGFGTHGAGDKQYPTSFRESLELIKLKKGFPKQCNEHNALYDARWNFSLHQFLLKN